MRADLVVLATDHAAQAGEEALDIVGVLAVQAVRLGMVDAAHWEVTDQIVPVCGLVCEDG